MPRGLKPDLVTGSGVQAKAWTHLRGKSKWRKQTHRKQKQVPSDSSGQALRSAQDDNLKEGRPGSLKEGQYLGVWVGADNFGGDAL